MCSYNFPTGRRRAFPEKVVDGDTFDAGIDLGFGITAHHRIRLLGVNTPELNSSDPALADRARQAKLFVMEWLELSDEAWPLALEISKSLDKYGRYLARVFKTVGGREICLNDVLVANGLGEKV